MKHTFVDCFEVDIFGGEQNDVLQFNHEFVDDQVLWWDHTETPVVDAMRRLQHHFHLRMKDQRS